MLVWALAGIVAYVGLLAAETAAVRVALPPTAEAQLGGAILMVAGIYQLTPLKEVCLSKCRTPISFIMTSWRDGTAGAFRMGLLHGVYCLGCCWLLFAILFPLGITNVGAMAAVTLIILAEKTLPWPRLVPYAAAVALVLYGALVIASPQLHPTFKCASSQSTSDSAGPDGRGGWIGNLQDARRVPYLLPELVKAVAAGETIYVPEGEKDVDNLRAIGLAATTNPGGIKKWRDEYSEYLRGADVVVLPDNHAEGREHGEQVVASLHGIAKRIRILDIGKHWDRLPGKGDISDWLAAGHTGEELAKLIEAAPDYVPPEGAKKEASPASNGNGIDDAAELERLARLVPLDYDRARKDAGKRLGISRLVAARCAGESQARRAWPRRRRRRQAGTRHFIARARAVAGARRWSDVAR